MATMPDIGALLKRATIGDLIEMAIARNAGQAPAVAPAEATFRKEGETWVLGFAGKTVYMFPRIGLDYIAFLLANPHESVRVTSLYAAVTGRSAGAETKRHCVLADTNSPAAPRSSPSVRTRESMTDGTTLAECHERLRDIEQELAHADAMKDESLSVRLHKEREMLHNYLGACTNRSGRIRIVTDTHEKVRKSVTIAISRAIAAISPQHEALGRHLRSSIRTGSDVVYAPEIPVEWRL